MLDVAFQNFFFSRLKRNATGRYEQEFPFLSLCGREHNFLRCDDCPPIVFHSLKPTLKELDLAATPQSSNMPELVFAGSLSAPFNQKNVTIGEDGRLYYPLPLMYETRQLGKLGLIGAHLAMELAERM
jgi:hypothetical protein